MYRLVVVNDGTVNMSDSGVSAITAFLLACIFMTLAMGIRNYSRSASADSVTDNGKNTLNYNCIGFCENNTINQNGN